MGVCAGELDAHRRERGAQQINQLELERRKRMKRPGKGSVLSRCIEAAVFVLRRDGLSSRAQGEAGRSAFRVWMRCNNVDDVVEALLETILQPVEGERVGKLPLGPPHTSAKVAGCLGKGGAAGGLHEVCEFLHRKVVFPKIALAVEEQVVDGPHRASPAKD